MQFRKGILVSKDHAPGTGNLPCDIPAFAVKNFDQGWTEILEMLKASLEGARV